MMRGQWTRPVARRLAVLLAGNVLLLVAIAFLLKEGASFEAVLLRIGPDLAPVVIAGLGLTAIMFTGAIDLSIGSVLVVAATLYGIMAERGAPPWSCTAGCMGVAWLLITGNGLIIRHLRLPAIIVTLAGLPLYRGLALMLADTFVPNFTGNISLHDPAYKLPGTVYPGWILSVALLATGCWGLFGRGPRELLALGSSEEACRLIGLQPGKLLVRAFCVGGLLLGVAALLYTTRVQAIEPARMALGFELQVVGAVVLGGTNIFGGEGSFMGTALGALFLYLIGQVLVYAGASPYLQDAIAGAVILTVIGADCGLHRKRKQLEELA